MCILTLYNSPLEQYPNALTFVQADNPKESSTSILQSQFDL